MSRYKYDEQTITKILEAFSDPLVDDRRGCDRIQKYLHLIGIDTKPINDVGSVFIAGDFLVLIHDNGGRVMVSVGRLYDWYSHRGSYGFRRYENRRMAKLDKIDIRNGWDAYPAFVYAHSEPHGLSERKVAHDIEFKIYLFERGHIEIM